MEYTTLTQAIIEALAKRAQEHGDSFNFAAGSVYVRCFRPKKHLEGDKHPSSKYYAGKYIVCKICGFKESEKKLAERLGINQPQSGPTKQADAEARDQEQSKIEEEQARLVEEVRPLLEDPGVLHRAVHTIEDLGVVGERRNVALLHLQMRSRVLPRPINMEINSPSSSGKTHTVSGVLKIEDEKAYYELTGSSERALIYSDEPLQHRILFVHEPEGLSAGVGAAAIKSLSWEGKLMYDTVVKEAGKLVGKHIDKAGPTGLIVATTRPLDDQITNRLLHVEVNSGDEQTRRVLLAIADTMNDADPVVDLESWRALSKVLGEPIDVVIPFGRFIAERVSTCTLRIRRDFRQLLTLIAASAVEHCYQRHRDNRDRVIANLADYAHIYALTNDMFRAAQADGITKPDREIVSLVEFLSTPVGGSPGNIPVTQAELRRVFGLSKSTASYRINRLIDMGYLLNLETHKGRPMRLVPGDPLPAEPEPFLPIEPGEKKYAKYFFSELTPEKRAYKFGRLPQTIVFVDDDVIKGCHQFWALMISPGPWPEHGPHNHQNSEVMGSLGLDWDNPQDSGAEGGEDWMGTEIEHYNSNNVSDFTFMPAGVVHGPVRYGKRFRPAIQFQCHYGPKLTEKSFKHLVPEEKDNLVFFDLNGTEDEAAIDRQREARKQKPEASKE